MWKLGYGMINTAKMMEIHAIQCSKFSGLRAKYDYGYDGGDYGTNWAADYMEFGGDYATADQKDYIIAAEQKDYGVAVPGTDYGNGDYSSFPGGQIL